MWKNTCDLTWFFHKCRENRECERKIKGKKIELEFNQYGEIKRQMNREGGRVKERIEK